MSHRMLMLGCTVLLIAGQAAADLQNVEVGGRLHIRGYYWTNTFNEEVAPGFVGAEIRWPGFFMGRRPIGDVLGGRTVVSHYGWDERGSDYQAVAQRTRLHVDADFTDEVRAFIELDAFSFWGEDFRSDWITGLDGRPQGVVGQRLFDDDEVSIYQAFIEADQMWGMPLRLRVGRQELVLGSGWLVGANHERPEFAGLSFDAVRLTYGADVYQLDAFYAKLAERGTLEQDGDVDFMGVYGTYSGVEDVDFDLYWLWLRDARSINDTNYPWWGEWIEDVLDLDDYDPTNLHTFGARAAGAWGAFDFEAEAAYQMGEADRIGSLFFRGIYGDDEAEFDAWAAHAELGYSFDAPWQPRIYAGGAWFEGEDNRDNTFWETLFTPWKGEASVSFNRLFSDVTYSRFIDEMGQLSNAWVLRGGASVSPMESVDAGVDVSYFQANETFDRPLAFRLGRYFIPIAPNWAFLTEETDEELGWETHLWVRYAYSEDLLFTVGWARFFTGEGLTRGNYTDLNGLLFSGGTGDDDADYLYVDAKLLF